MLVSSPPDNNKVEKVLVYRLGSLGDTIVSLPCLHLIARSYPNANRVLLAEFPINVKAPASSAVIGESGLIHGYMRYIKGTRDPFELLALWWRLRKFRPDVLVFLMGRLDSKVVRRNITFFRSAGIRNFIGLPYGDLAKWQFDPVTGLFESEAHRLARCLAPLGDARVADPASWDLKLTQAEVAIAERKLGAIRGRRFIACSIGSKAQAKDWTLPNWTALMRKLTSLLPDYNLLFVGSPDEREACDGLGAIWSAQTVNLCGELSPRESAAALRKAALFIGHDSGPLHLAASVQVPSVGIYASRNLPGVWFPFGSQNRIIYHNVACRDCRLNVCVEQKKKCILSITVDEVLEAALMLLPRSASVG